MAYAKLVSFPPKFLVPARSDKGRPCLAYQLDIPNTTCVLFISTILKTRPAPNLLEDGIVEGNWDEVTSSSSKHTLDQAVGYLQRYKGDPFCVWQPVTLKAEKSDKAPTSSHQRLWKYVGLSENRVHWYTMVHLNPMVCHHLPRPKGHQGSGPSKPSSFGCKDSRDLDGFQAPAPNPQCSHPPPAGSPGLECRRDLDSRRQDARFGRNGTSLAEKTQIFIGFIWGIMSEGDGIDPGTVNEAVCETTVEI